MTLRRGGTPLMGRGSGIPTLEASNQAQIEDLVQRNRTLEHTNKKLSEQLAQEHSRSKDAIFQLQTQWNINQIKWKETCENLLGSYRIVHKRIEVELEKERVNTLKEMKITREEKLLRLQRDFKISLFQMKEEELERKVQDVEDEKMRLMEENGLVVQKMQEKCADCLIKLRDTQALLTRNEKEMEEKETKFNKLVEDRANLEAASESIKSKLERTKLQLDGAQTRNSELERLNDELKRINAELTRQLDKWQSLETKEGEAAEAERKQRIALEIELREIKEISEKKVEKATADLEKAKGRVEKIRITVREWEEAYENAHADAENAEKRLAKAQKRIEKLQSELEAERSKVRPPSPQNRKASTPPQDEDIPQEDEPVEIEPASPPPRKAKPSSVKPPYKQITETIIQESKSNESQERIRSRTARKSTGGKPPKKPSPPSPTVLQDSDIEEIPDPSAKKKGKAKAAETDEDLFRVAAVPREKGKRKAPSDDDDNIQVVEQPKRQKTRRAGSEMKETVRTRTKPAASKQPAKVNEEKDNDDSEGTADVTQKNAKKRKINIFPTGNDAIQFSFATISSLNDDRLNIPTTLSPVKEDELVPNRSTASIIKPYSAARR